MSVSHLYFDVNIPHRLGAQFVVLFWEDVEPLDGGLTGRSGLLGSDLKFYNTG